MTQASPSTVEAGRTTGDFPQGTLLPTNRDPDDTTAWWALDISRARPAIAAIAARTGPPARSMRC